MRQLLMCLVLILLMGANLWAQAPDTLWTALYGDKPGWDGYDQLYGATPTYDGGFAMNGFTTTWGDTIKGDQWVVKIDANGDTLWTVPLGDFDRRDYGRDIIETYDNCLVVCGHGRVANTSEDYRIRLFKIDSLGNTIWDKNYVGGNGFNTERIIETADSGFAIVGWTDDKDVFLFRADSLGDSLWTQTYGGVDDDMGYGLAQTADDGFMLVGATESYGFGSYDMYVIKTDAVGDTVWTHTLGGPGYEEARAICKTHDGSYMVAGSQVTSNTDIYLMMVQDDGNAPWGKNVGQAAGNDSPYGITRTSDNGFLIAGKNYNTITGRNSMYLLKVNADGDTLWSYTHITSTHDEARIAFEAGSGYTYLFGTRASSSSGDYRDYWAIAFGLVSDVAEDGPASLPSAFALSDAYPNPFNPSTTIDYSVPARAPVTIEVYNIVGQRIRTLVDETKPAGEYRAVWDGCDATGQTVATGVYLYRFRAGDFAETKRMVLLK